MRLCLFMPSLQRIGPLLNRQLSRKHWRLKLSELLPREFQQPVLHKLGPVPFPPACRDLSLASHLRDHLRNLLTETLRETH